MFSQQLRTAPTAALQQQAFAYAVRSKNVELMCQLAQVPDLLPELDEALGKREELDVLSAWSSRPGRTTAEILKRFEKEKRATLLLGLAETEGLPAELYEQLAARKSVTVNWELLQNASVSDDLKSRLAVTLGNGLTLKNSGLYDKVKPVRQLNDDLYDTFVSALNNASALRVLMHGTETQIPRMRSLIAAAVRLCDNAEECSGAAWLLREMLDNPEFPEELYEELKAECTRVVTDASSLAIGAERWEAGRLSDSLQRAEKRRTTDLDALLQQVVDAGSVSALDHAITVYIGTVRDLQLRWDLGELGRRVLNNPYCQERHVRDYSRDLDSVSITLVVNRAVENDDVDLARTVFTCAGYTGFDAFASAYKDANDPEAFMSWVVGDLTEAPYWLTRSSVVTQDPALALRLLPVATTLSTQAYADNIAVMLADKLGDSRQRWETFTALVDEWTGSFTALVDTAVGLAPSE